jgi:hypothetical protein
MVELKISVLEILGYAVHSDFGSMHPRTWIQARYDVVVVLFTLLIGDGALANGNADAIIDFTIVGLLFLSMLHSPIANHADEIHIARISRGDIAFFLDLSGLFALRVGQRGSKTSIQ